MSKNLMPEVAKMLGVEIGEKFDVNYIREIIGRYAIYEDGLFLLNEDGSKRPIVDDRLLGQIMRGCVEIVKLPREPHEGDVVSFPNPSIKCTDQYHWTGDAWDLALKALDMLYGTQAEAEKNFAADYEKLTGKPLEV